MSRRYRNRRVGEFLKELDLTEGRSTGITKILKVMAANGSPAPEFETDDERTYFLIRLPVHRRAPGTIAEVTDEVTGKVAGEADEAHDQAHGRHQVGTKSAPSRHQVGTKSKSSCGARNPQRWFTSWLSPIVPIEPSSDSKC